jgi:hypothetical protein
MIEQVGVTSSETKFDTTYPLPDDVRNFVKPLKGTQINFQTSLSLEQIATFYHHAFAKQGVTERKTLTTLSQEFISLVFEGISEDSIIVLQSVDLAYSSNQDLRNVNLRTDKDPWKLDDCSEKPIKT